MWGALFALSIVFIPFGLIIGWRVSPYFISSLDEAIYSRFEIWLKRVGFAVGCGVIPAMVIGIVSSRISESESGVSSDKVAEAKASIQGRAYSPENVSKMIAEKEKARIANHPACSEIYKQEELNHGDNELMCANSELESAGKSLNATYEQVHSKLAVDRQAVLESEQASWIHETNSYCDDAPNRSLSMSPRFREAATNFCAADAMRKREELIKNFR